MEEFLPTVVPFGQDMTWAGVLIGPHTSYGPDDIPVRSDIEQSMTVAAWNEVVPEVVFIDRINMLPRVRNEYTE